MRSRFPSLMIALATLIASVTLTAQPAAASGGYVYSGDPFYTSGGGRCTVAFTVVGNTTPFSGFITAGGCVQLNQPVYSAGGEVMGYAVAVSYPGNNYALVSLIPSWIPRGGIRVGGTIISIRGSTEAPVGASVCRAGSTTGWHCGSILSKNVTVYYPGGVVYGLTRTNVCAEPGDTGGPFISGDQAQGISLGGSGNCTSGGTTFFQPVNEVLAAYNVRILGA